MAPSKRAASATQAAGAKKRARTTKLDPVAKLCQAIAEGLETEATKLSETSLKMLVAMLPGSVGVPKAERHQVQEAVFEMVEKAFKDAELVHVSRVAELQAVLDTATDEKEKLELAREEAAAIHSAKMHEVDGKLTEQAGCEEAKRTAKAALIAAEQAQAVAAGELKPVAEHKARCEGALAEHVGIVLAGAWTTPEQAQVSIDALVSLGKQLAFDDSLMQGLPAAALKTAEARGPFDGMLLEQVKEQIAKAAASFERTLTNAQGDARERDVVIDAAKAALEAAVARAMEVAAAVEAKEKEATELREQQQAAAKAVKDHAGAVRQAKNAHTRADAELACFRAAYLEKLAGPTVEEAVAEAPQPEAVEASQVEA